MGLFEWLVVGLLAVNAIILAVGVTSLEKNLIAARWALEDIRKILSDIEIQSKKDMLSVQESLWEIAARLRNRDDC